MAEEQLRLQQEVPSRIERKIYNTENSSLSDKKTHTRPSFPNFLAMIIVAMFFDGVGIFTNEIPGVGFVIVMISNLIFIPWFYASGMKINSKRITVLGFETFGESIPIVGNLPLITGSILMNYYLN